jgi:hypothetical protein
MKTIYASGIFFRFILIILLCMKYTAHAQEQSGDTKTITVLLADKETVEVLPFANVAVYSSDNEQLQAGTTNMDGLVTFELPSMESYIIRGNYIGYQMTTDTIMCRLPRCIRSLSIGLVSATAITCWGVIYDLYESVEELHEAERLYERMEEEAWIKEDLNDFICFPNPVKDELKIQVDGVYATELLIMDQKGSLLFKKEITMENFEFEFDVRFLAAGYYYVVCRGEGLSSHTKTIVKIE